MEMEVPFDESQQNTVALAGPSGVVAVAGPSGVVAVAGPSGVVAVAGPSGVVAVAGPSGVVGVADGDMGLTSGQLRHFALMYAKDSEAMTEDPVKMEDNYKFPIIFPTEDAKYQLFGGNVFCELIVSPTYVMGLDGKRKRHEELLPVLEKYKGKYRTFSPGEKLDRVLYGSELQLALPPNTFNKSSLALLTPKPSKVRYKAKRPSHGNCDANGFGSTTVVSISVNGLHIAVSLNSVKVLAPKAYINDEIIDYYMLRCLNLFEMDVIDDVLYFPTYFWQMCVYHDLNADLSQIQRGTLYKIATGRGAQPNLLRKKIVIIPVARESHWILVIVCRPFPTEELVKQVLKGTPCNQCTREQADEIYKRWLDGDVGDSHEHGKQKPMMLLFDSMTAEMEKKCINYKDFHQSTFSYTKTALIRLHTLFWENSNSAELLIKARTTDFDIEHRAVRSPGQDNTADCGIFCIACALAWLEVLTGNYRMEYTDAAKMDFSLLFGHQDLKDEREKMFSDIAENSPPELQHHINKMRLTMTVNDEPSNNLAIKSELANYRPTPKPFEHLRDVISGRKFMLLNHAYNYGYNYDI